MADLDPWQRGFLRTLSGSESSYGNRDPYRVMYGGSMFSDFGDHPRQGQLIRTGPNAGRTSSAAGGYQFLGSTWDSVAPRAGVSDFSPASQDQAALFLAQDVYRRKTGRELQADIQAARRDPQKLGDVLSALHGTWTSLPGGIEPNNATRSAGQRFLNQLNFADTEADGSKPALYGGPQARNSDVARTGKMYLDPNSPMRDPNVQPSVNGFTQIAPPVGSGAPQYPAADSPSFLDHPVDWLNTRTGEDTTRADALMQAAAALMAVNNPKGAEVLAAQAHTRFPGAEEWSTSFDKNGGIIQSSSRGGVRYRPGAPQPPAYDTVAPAVQKQLDDAAKDQATQFESSKAGFDLLKASYEGKLDNSLFSRWGAKAASIAGIGKSNDQLVNQLDRYVYGLTAAHIKQIGGRQPTDADFENTKKMFFDTFSQYDPITLQTVLRDNLRKSSETFLPSYERSIQQAQYANPKAHPGVWAGSKDFIDEQKKFYKSVDDYEANRDKQAAEAARASTHQIVTGAGFKYKPEVKQRKGISSSSLPSVIPQQIVPPPQAPAPTVAVNPRTGAPIPPLLPSAITRRYNPRGGVY